MFIIPKFGSSTGKNHEKTELFKLLKRKRNFCIFTLFWKYKRIRMYDIDGGAQVLHCTKTIPWGRMWAALKLLCTSKNSPTPGVASLHGYGTYSNYMLNISLAYTHTHWHHRGNIISYLYCGSMCKMSNIN